MPPSICSCEPGGGDDDVRLELLAGFEPDPGLREGLDLIGLDRGSAVAQRVQQVAAEHGAQALVPGHVLAA